jgi:hypothetical protein
MRLRAALAGGIALGVLAGGAAQAQTAPAPDGWQFSATPYLWMVGLGGKVTTQQHQSVSANVNFDNVLSHLNGAVMLLGNAQYGRWVGMADFDYANLSAKPSGRSLLIGYSGLSSTMYLGTLTGGYRVIDSAEGTLDAMGGLRVTSLNNTFDASGGLIPGFAVHNGDTWVNPIAAARGKVELGRGFFLSGYGDIGVGGDNDFTWQMYGGAGYTINPQFSAFVGYRYLEMRHDANGLILNIDEQGPLLGISYRF